MEQPNYYAVIPANVRYDKKLRANEKLLYGEITTLTLKTGECWASNNYFASLYDCTPQAISKWINNLEKAGYITTEIIYKEDGKEVEKRVIRIVPINDLGVSTNVEGGINKELIGVSTNDLEGYQQMFKEKNTSIKESSIKKREIKKRKFIPPTLEEVKVYIQEKQLNVDGQKFIDYFEQGDWTDSKGNKVKNWKQKLLTWSSYSTTKQDDRKFYDSTNQYSNTQQFYANFEGG